MVLDFSKQYLRQSSYDVRRDVTMQKELKWWVYITSPSTTHPVDNLWQKL